MLRALDITGQCQGSSVTLPPVKLAAQTFPGRLSGVRQLTRQGEISALAIHGSIYNIDEAISNRGPDSDPLLDLLRLYLEKGVGFVERLRGEFAIAVWDGREETLHLVTDRFRVHPIFYYRDERNLVFGSRMKAILACAFPLRLAINAEAIVNVVGSSFIPTPQTIYRGVHKLPPGYRLSYRRDTVKLTRYWDINFNEADGRSEARLAEELRSVFTDAVSVRLNREGDVKRAGSFLNRVRRATI
jgi:asparagine synthase (glutamine-hydrolysing)